MADFKIQTYLVTGGAGFIGSNFVHHVLATHEHARVVNVDALTYAGNLENLADVQGSDRYTFVQADIRDGAAMARLLAETGAQVVVNFAAESHVDRSISAPAAFESTNVAGTVALLDAARGVWKEADGSFGQHLFLQVGTDEVYGSLPLGEPDKLFREDTPLAPNSPYSASKAAADMFVSAYTHTFGLPAIITRCSNNYGPYQFPEKLIPLMINNCLQHRALPVYGDGANVRDWLYVEDHCAAIDAVLAAGRVGEVYNVGGHNERANIDIVRTIIAQVAAATGDAAINESLIEYVADRPGHDRRYAICPDKITREVGWAPQTRFEEGIAATISWNLQHKPWVEHVTSGAYLDYYQKMYGARHDSL